MQQYMVSRSTISNPGRATQHEKLCLLPPNTPVLTTNSILSIRQQMDKSNPKMVNMRT